MGLFGKLFKKKRVVKAKTTKSADEKGKLREDKFLRRLERLDPETYKEIMLGKLGIKTPKTLDNLTIMVETVSKLKQAGIIVDPNAAGDSEWKDILKSLGAGIGMGFMQNMQQQQQAAQQPQVREVIEQQPEPQHIPPNILAERNEPQMPEPAGDSREEKVSYLVSIAKRELESRTPQAGAEWLMGLPVPQVKGLINQIVGTPDTQLPILMDNLARAYPDFAGLIDWLRQNPEKFIGIVHALRDMSAPMQQQPKSKMGF